MVIQAHNFIREHAMRIYLASDLHIEMFEDFQLPDRAVDVVVLAGDIHKGHNIFEVAAEFRRHFHAPVVMVAGNHEYYGLDYVQQLSKFRHNTAMLRNIFFLENEQVIIGNSRYLGATLWSSFALYGYDSVAASQAVAQRSVRDFQVIRYNGRRFTPADAEAEYHKSYAWLESKLAEPFDGKTIVITHFCPHRAGIHARHASTGGDHLTPYFVSDCSGLMQRFQIDAWFYGHTHFSVDTVVENNTRLISNQRGYPSEYHRETGFDLEKVIII